MEGPTRPQPLSLFQPSTLIHQPTSTAARLVTFSDEAIRGVKIGRRNTPGSPARHYYRKSVLFDRLLAFDVKMDFADGLRH